VFWQAVEDAVLTRDRGIYNGTIIPFYRLGGFICSYGYRTNTVSHEPVFFSSKSCACGQYPEFDQKCTI